MNRGNMIFQRNLIAKLSLFLWLNFLCQGIDANLQARIINGQEVKWNSTRYQVSIRLEEIDRYFFGVGHLCGGSIITRNAVLTSAHCIWNSSNKSFYPASKFSVVMGNLDRSLNNANSLKLSVSKIVIGTHFNTGTFQDDLAIMFLNQSIPENFTGAELIELNKNFNITDGEMCLVTGWGLTEKQIYTRNLMMVEVPILNKTVCSVNYGSETLLDGMLCAGYMSGESDACTGDSGGPLVCNSKLVGIVSFGLGCAMPGYPGVYTNVAYYYDWISNQAGLSNKNYKLDLNFTVASNLNGAANNGSSTGKFHCNYLVIICSIFWMAVKH